MERRLFLQVTAPMVLMELLLFAVCLVSAWSVNPFTRIKDNNGEDRA
jgi:hypothetical protein